jgi:hypothetical protein
MPIPLSKKLLSVFLACALLSPILPAQALESSDSASITLEKAVQFEDPQGEDVLVSPGTYVVTEGEETLHLTANDSDTSVTIEADENSHKANILTPTAASIPGQDGPLANTHVVILFLPDGHALQSIGTYPGIQSRGIPADTDLSGSTTTITFEKAVHFIAPDGSPVVAAPGRYTAEAAQDWIRLIPGEERQNALLVEAQKGTNDTGVEELVALSLPGSTEKELDLHFVMLLLPTGQTLEATGSYSGIQPRGFFKKTFNKAKRTASRTYKKARGGARKASSAVKNGTSQAAQKAKRAALKAKRAAEHSARVAAAVSVKFAKEVAKRLPKIRRLTTSEKKLAKSVFRNTIKYGMVRVTNTVGGGGRPWTTNTPPFYMINVGKNYRSLTANDDRKRLLIHELVHVWQGQHLVPFMRNSAAHQTLSAINNGGATASAYSYTVGKPWRKYNVEQQASIVAHWFTPANLCFENGPCGGGMKTTDSRYRYIRDHIRKNKAH